MLSFALKCLHVLLPCILWTLDHSVGAAAGTRIKFWPIRLIVAPLVFPRCGVLSLIIFAAPGHYTAVRWLVIAVPAMVQFGIEC